MPIQANRSTLMTTYGVSLDDNGMMMTCILGAALTAFAIALWLNRNIPSTDRSWHNLLLASSIYNRYRRHPNSIATLNGVMNSMGGCPSDFTFFLAATFGYFVFKKNQITFNFIQCWCKSLCMILRVSLSRSSGGNSTNVFCSISSFSARRS